MAKDLGQQDNDEAVVDPSAERVQHVGKSVIHILSRIGRSTAFWVLSALALLLTVAKKKIFVLCSAYLVLVIYVADIQFPNNLNIIEFLDEAFAELDKVDFPSPAKMIRYLVLSALIGSGIFFFSQTMVSLSNNLITYLLSL